MKVRRRRKKDIRRILIKTVLYATLLAAGELLAGVGGYYCIMTHLPDAVGIPLLTAGFFLIVVFSCSVQEKYDRKKEGNDSKGLHGSGRGTCKMGL